MLVAQSEGVYASFAWTGKYTGANLYAPDFRGLGYYRAVTKEAEIIEGEQAFTRFDETIRAILAVPRSEIIRREEDYKRQSELNPHKRGPKKKRKSASRVPFV